MKHSRRYQEIKEKIPSNKYYSLSESLNFLQNNNQEKIKSIKATKAKIAIVKDNLPTSIISVLQKSKQVELLTSEELQQRTIANAPKGIYPNKKNGSLTENILEEAEKFLQGEKELRTDKSGNIQIILGRSDFSQAQLEENYKKLYDKITSLRPMG
ncbi:915_t:CDS:2 [Entrophospora sp. SA101]|nr:2711_t:CDS:2 [Entrophospora sp. SA101]CAJ0749858.1 915_t:CDS:2 [Entrophospora sp. SA101]CAJ0842147.1 882_t:CDS:2 [Entrophospora sp. SA101]CAJ0873171.1 3411_t:CDS:2 [Entrophospora sp. SA101]